MLVGQIETGLAYVCRDSDLPQTPASCPARSLTESRKAKKSGPSSSRRKRPHPHRPLSWGQHPDSQRRLLAAPVGTVATAEAASFWEDESGIPPASLAPRNGASRRVFRTRPSAQGAAWEGGGERGVLWPRRGQRGRWAVDEIGDGDKRLQGARSGARERGG